jgi:hypothetical protein
MEKLDVDPQEGERRGYGHLDLREDQFGASSYFLESQRLENGEAIELLLADGTWLRGTYEWRGIPVVWPALRLDLAGRVSRSSERRNSTAMPLPPTAVVRRPKNAGSSDEEAARARRGGK